jgi:uncharacterized repeat protein (TIGR03803 family)
MLFTSASLTAVALLPVAASANPFTVLHQFHNGGKVSRAGLVNIGTRLFGTTMAGGAGQTGRVFNVSINGGNAEATVHDFAADGSDGQDPQAALTKVGQFLYGTAQQGGNGAGVLFKVHPNGLGYTVVHTFTGCCGDGANPSANLIYANGFIYGTTQVGGTGYAGTIFEVHTTNDSYSVLYSFGGGADGQVVNGGLIKIGDYLYGTTRDGGTPGYGTVFKIKTDGTGKLTLHPFTGGTTDGANPYSAMVSFAGALYGTTYTGGQYGFGTVFKVDTASGSGYALLHSFGGVGDGKTSQGGLLPVYTNAGTPGLLYGTTTSGGSAGIGTVYKINASGTETVVHSFTGNQGASPASELINVIDGNGHNQLYGTAYNGGLYGYGTVFRFTP